jgi:hypothetical protein
MSQPINEKSDIQWLVDASLSKECPHGWFDWLQHIANVLDNQENRLNRIRNDACQGFEYAYLMDEHGEIKTDVPNKAAREFVDEILGILNEVG